MNPSSAIHLLHSQATKNRSRSTERYPLSSSVVYLNTLYRLHCSKTALCIHHGSFFLFFFLHCTRASSGFSVFHLFFLLVAFIPLPPSNHSILLPSSSSCFSLIPHLFLSFFIVVTDNGSHKNHRAPCFIFWCTAFLQCTFIAFDECNSLDEYATRGDASSTRLRAGVPMGSPPPARRNV